MKLFDGQRSPNARKVRLLAAELGIELDLVRLDFGKGEYRSPEYLAKNPNGRVPVLDDDGFILWESAAILKYLAAKHPERGLVPSDLKRQAIIDQWLCWWTAHPEVALLKLAVEKLIKPFLGQPANDPNIIAGAEADVARFFPILDRQLEGREFIADTLSVVDFAVGPWLDGLPRLGLALTSYSNITSWLARMNARPYWKDT